MSRATVNRPSNFITSATLFGVPTAPPPAEETRTGNAAAVPLPIKSEFSRDYARKGDVIFDGDYITLRNLAWGGVTLSHASGGKQVSGFRKPGGDLDLGTIANAYSWCIRKIVYDTEKKAFVLPHLKVRPERGALTKQDYFVLICPDTPDLVLGTRLPPTYGNNGDYRCELINFVLANVEEVHQNTAVGFAQRFISAGFWNSDKNNVDFVNQSRCIWEFHGGDQNEIVYGAKFNIRNLWSEVKARETSMWQAAGGAQWGLIGTTIQKTFNGGRNLTQAAGSGGSVVKLALTNKDNDDKANWILDPWDGNHYPVQRVYIPTDAPPPGVDLTSLPVLHYRQGIETTVGTDQYDPTTDSANQDALEDKTKDQNKENWIDWLCRLVFGKRWNQLNTQQSLIIVALVPLFLFGVTEIIIKKI